MTRGKTNKLDVSSMLRYFQPLNDWLKRKNKIEPVIGWVTNQDDTS